MTVETNARFINDLNEAYPRNKDLIKEGDDHLRLIKSTLKNTFPGIDEAVSATAAKLNKLDDTFEFEGSTGTVQSDLKFAEGKTLDMGENRIKNCGLAKDEDDVVTVAYLQNYNWPIGSIYMTVDARNPKEIFGFGEWEIFAKGKVIVGTGIGIDSNSDTKTFVNGATGGLYTTKLTTENLPAHIHGMSTVKVGKGGEHKHDSGVAIREGASHPFGKAEDRPTNHSYEHHKYDEQIASPWTSEVEGHEHKLEGSSDPAGSGTPSDNLQPWIACNIWQRLK